MAFKKPKRKVTYLNDVFITGVARYPKISEPDIHGDKADGKHKVDIVPDATELARVKKLLKSFAEGCFPDADGDFKLPIKKDKKDDSIVFIPAKSTKAPFVMDAKKVRMKAGHNIGAGSILKIKVTAADYEASPMTENKPGINLYLEAVQVIKYVEARDPTAGFGEEEGFAGGNSFEDESGSGSDDTNAGGGDAYAL